MKQPRTQRGSNLSPGCAVVFSLVAILAAHPDIAVAWSFTDVTAEAGFNYEHGIVGGATSDPLSSTGGVAAGDYDNDGYVDLYVVRGDIGPNLLFRNAGDGTFEEVGAAAGVDITGVIGNGPVFADYDGDGNLDLFVGGHVGGQHYLFRNNGDGTFADVTGSCGLDYSGGHIFSTSFGDYDGDADLDAFMCHWETPQFAYGHLWRNNGDGTFAEMDTLAGFGLFGDGINDWTFAANWVDIDSDGDPDLLISADFGTSEVYENNGDGTFSNITDEGVITDENGMGSAIGDYDNDLDLDWFVSSISPEPMSKRARGTSGNRLYENDGTGTFTDVTDSAGVRIGHWGWGSSFEDFNNDGWLDLYHVNGMRGTWGYASDPAVFFVSNGDKTFTEQASSFGIDHTGQGRGIVCFDYDRDGDLDIFVANNSGPPVFYRNDGGNDLNWLDVRLVGSSPNTEAIGARIYVSAGGATQMRELRAGSNYLSQDPAEAHFGVNTATVIDSMRIVWPSGSSDLLFNLPVNSRFTFTQNPITDVFADPRPGADALSPHDLFPNPFAEAATFRLRVDREHRVRLAIYDLSGRTVRTLADGVMPPGDREIRWDGRDAGGRALGAGVYLYRLESAGAVTSGKVSIVR